MNALSKIEFKNFQSLVDTSIELSPGFNCLVGPSNLGKSAAIRALKAMVYNTPATGLVREGAKQFETKAWFADGQSVSLIKGKNKSEFYWNDDVFAKAGASDVPVVVAQQWGVTTPDGRQLCFASQHEPPFLLAEPASAAAKVLGDLTNASMLMRAVGEANKLRTQASNDAKARQREADEAREEILTHAGLTTRGKVLKSARTALSAVQDASSMHDELVQIRDAFNNIEHERAELTQLTETSVSIESSLAELVSAIDNLKELRAIEKEFREIDTALQVNDSNKKTLQYQLEEEQNMLDVLLEDTDFCPLCGNEIH